MVVKTAFSIKGNTPAKKNSRVITRRGGKILNIPSQIYRKWHDDALWQIEEMKIPESKPNYSITYYFWFKDKRKHDLDNAQASVNDLLKDAGVIIDDDSKLLVETHCYYMGVSKENPRVEIEISSGIPIDKT